jgi:hypothetical protein
MVLTIVAVGKEEKVCQQTKKRVYVTYVLAVSVNALTSYLFRTTTTLKP